MYIYIVKEKEFTFFCVIHKLINLIFIVKINEKFSDTEVAKKMRKRRGELLYIFFC